MVDEAPLKTRYFEDKSVSGVDQQKREWKVVV